MSYNQGGGGGHGPPFQGMNQPNMNAGPRVFPPPPNIPFPAGPMSIPPPGYAGMPQMPSMASMVSSASMAQPSSSISSSSPSQRSQGRDDDNKKWMDLAAMFLEQSTNSNSSNNEAKFNELLSMTSKPKSDEGSSQQQQQQQQQTPPQNHQSNMGLPSGMPGMPPGFPFGFPFPMFPPASNMGGINPLDQLTRMFSGSPLAPVSTPQSKYSSSSSGGGRGSRDSRNDYPSRNTTRDHNSSTFTDVTATTAAAAQSSSAEDDYEDLSENEDDLEDDYEDISDDDLDEDDEDDDMESFISRQFDLFDMDRVKGYSLKVLKSPILWVLDQIDGSTVPEEKEKRLVELLQAARSLPSGKRWVVHLEEVHKVSVDGLARLKSAPQVDPYQDKLVGLLAQTMRALEWEVAMEQEVGYNIRQLKIGFQLVTQLASLDYDALKVLLEAKIFETLFGLINQELMTSPMKMFAFEALNALCSCAAGVRALLAADGYQALVDILDSQSKLVRVTHACSIIAGKIHIYELIDNFYNNASELVKKMQKNDDSIEISSFHLENCLESLIIAVKEHGPNKLNVPPDVKILTSEPNEPFIFKMLYEKGFIDQIHLLLASPLATSQNRIFELIVKFFKWLTSSHRGRTFLASRRDAVIGCVECLNVDECSPDYEPFRSLAHILSINVQALLVSDKLLKVLKTDDRTSISEGSELLSYLEDTCILLQEDKTIVSTALVESGAVEELIKFVIEVNSSQSDSSTKDGESAANAKQPSSVPLAAYILLKAAECGIQLEQWGPKLMAVCESAERGRLVELSRWLEPLRNLKCVPEDVPGLVDFIKYRLNDLTSHFHADAPGLITSLRMMLKLATSGESTERTVACISLFSSCGFDILLKLCHCLKPYLWKHFRFHAQLSNGLQLLCHSLLIPIVKLLHSMISQVITAGDIEFRDLRVIRALLPLHSVVCAVPSSGLMGSEAASIQTAIVHLLQLYTHQYSDRAAAGDGGSSTGVVMGWSYMLEEVLLQLQFSPSCFISGLSLLSELIPLPLPILTPRELTDKQVEAIVENRKRWSLHLMSQEKVLKSLLCDLMTSSSRQLGGMLRRVSWQIADLSEELSILVIDCFTTVLADVLGSQSEQTWDSKISRLLVYLDHAVSQPSGKAAFIHLLNVPSPAAATSLTRLLGYLRVVNEKHEHEHVQYCVISIVQSLCDPSVTLLPFAHCNTSISQEIIGCSLPSESSLSMITQHLFDHACDPNQSLFTFQHAVKAIALLCIHDYGFNLVNSFIASQPDVIPQLILRIRNEPQGQRDEKNLQAFLSLLHLFQGSDLSDDFMSADRKMFIRGLRLKSLISSDGQGSLVSLDEYLKEKEIALSDCVKESLEDLLKLARKADAELENYEDVSGAAAAVSPPRMSLGEQFEQRAVFAVSPIEDERLAPTAWFSVSPELVSDLDLVCVDLDEICKDSLEGFSVFEQIKEGAKEYSKPRRLKRGRRYDPLISKGFKTKTIVRRPNYLAKEKGLELGPKRTDDVFRLRKQNTSRPPSMHVDDFILLEDAENQKLGAPAKKKLRTERKARKAATGNPGSPRRPIPSIATATTTTAANAPDKPSAINERGFFSASRGWISNLDMTRGKSGLNKTKPAVNIGQNST